MGAAYACKEVDRIGLQEGDCEGLKILNRIVEWEADAIYVEADQRQIELAVRELGLSSAKGSDTPGSKDAEEEPEEGEGLGADEMRQFRSVAARMNFVSQDRPETMYSCKEVCRDMANPTVQAMQKLRKLGR